MGPFSRKIWPYMPPQGTPFVPAARFYSHFTCALVETPVPAPMAPGLGSNLVDKKGQKKFRAAVSFCWYTFAKFGLKRVPRDPFRPNLFAFLFKIGQNGSKWVPQGSKGVQMWSKKGPPVSKCAQLGSKWLKMASTPVKMGQNRLQRGPEGQKGSKWPQIPQNGLFRSNLPKSSPERVHPALPDGWRWNWDPSAEGTPARFTISVQKCT